MAASSSSSSSSSEALLVEPRSSSAVVDAAGARERSARANNAARPLGACSTGLALGFASEVERRAAIAAPSHLPTDPRPLPRARSYCRRIGAAVRPVIFRRRAAGRSIAPLSVRSPPSASSRHPERPRCRSHSRFAAAPALPGLARACAWLARSPPHPGHAPRRTVVLSAVGCVEPLLRPLELAAANGAPDCPISRAPGRGVRGVRARARLRPRVIAAGKPSL